MKSKQFLGVLLAAVSLIAIPVLAASAAGISWTAPSAWKTEAERPMRAATYTIPAVPGDKESAECAVYYFGPGQGGPVQANMDRWMSQFEGGQNVKPNLVTQSFAGLKATSIDHSGTFLGGGPMMGGGTTRKPGYRMIATIVEAPQGSVFFKMTGPAKTIAAAKPAFDKMLQSIKKGS